MPKPNAHSTTPHPKKSLGQNWLTDESYLDRIVAAAELTASDTVLEIGPGLGNLTRRVAAQAGRVIAVELDVRLIEPLRQQFAQQPQVEIVHGDILDFDPADLAQNAEYGMRNAESGTDTPHSAFRIPHYKVVANLPYYIASAVLRHLLEANPPPTLAVVMVQKEVAERICAAPGEMSLLAVSVQFYARPRLVQQVPAAAFYPRPKVDSAVVRLDLIPPPNRAAVEPAKFFTLVRAGFSQKRKQLRNTVSNSLGMRKEAADELLTQAHIDPTRRAETLALGEWEQLYQAWSSASLHRQENL